MTEITRRTALGAAIVVPVAVKLTRSAWAAGPVEIDLFFPVPVQGKLADKMKELIDRFNGQQSAVKATAVYTGSYDDTSLKTRAAIKAGKPPGAVIMSANFVREYVINRDVDPFDPIIEKDGKNPSEFFDQFWPALKPNAIIDGKIYGIPYQNSMPLMYYNVAAFTDAGLDPDKPPTTWREWLEAARKLTKPGGERWRINLPATYDYCGWLTSAFVMQNGGQYYNHDYGGEVYYNSASTLGALTARHARQQGEGHAAWVSDANACTSAFFCWPARHDAAVDRFAELCARQYKIVLQSRIFAKKRAQRRADWRRFTDTAEGQYAGAAGRRVDVLMCTGLTFGSISALFGLTQHIIDQDQYTVLVTAVILSAVVPTLIAERWFQPKFRPLKEHGQPAQ